MEKYSVQYGRTLIRSGSLPQSMMGQNGLLGIAKNQRLHLLRQQLQSSLLRNLMYQLDVRMHLNTQDYYQFQVKLMITIITWVVWILLTSSGLNLPAGRVESSLGGHYFIGYWALLWPMLILYGITSAKLGLVVLRIVRCVVDTGPSMSKWY